MDDVLQVPLIVYWFNSPSFLSSLPSVFRVFSFYLSPPALSITLPQSTFFLNLFFQTKSPTSFFLHFKNPCLPLPEYFLDARSHSIIPSLFPFIIDFLGKVVIFIFFPLHFVPQSLLVRKDLFHGTERILKVTGNLEIHSTQLCYVIWHLFTSHVSFSSPFLWHLWYCIILSSHFFGHFFSLFLYCLFLPLFPSLSM